MPVSINSKRIFAWNNPELDIIRDRVKNTKHGSKLKKKLSRRLNEMECDAQKAYVADCVNQIKATNDDNKSRVAYKIINEVTGRKHSPKVQIDASNPNERLKGWANYFDTLLNVKENVSNSSDSWSPEKIFDSYKVLPIESRLITENEVLEALKSTSNNKATGLDSISAEFLKLPGISTIILPLLNKVMSTGVAFNEWHTNIIIPLPKKGDLSQYSNYRGISLMSIVGKLYNRILLERMRIHIDPILRYNQNGFRKSRGTVEHVLAIRRIIEGIDVKGGSAVLTFIDFKKAFDCINRGRMMKILKEYGVSDEVVKQLSAMYTDTKSTVRTNDGSSEFIDITTGVLQGDTLAPFLFVIMIDYVMRLAERVSGSVGLELVARKSSRRDAIKICDADFADDIALINSNMTHAQLFLSNVEKYAGDIGLSINSKKTEYIILGKSIADTGLMTKEGNIKRVYDFKYLGCWIMNTKKDMLTRIGQAWIAAKKLNLMWRSQLDRKNKISFFQATVQSVLLYGCESWSLNDTLSKRLDGAYSRLLRYALNVNWYDDITNVDVYGDLPKISKVVTIRRVRFAGHCIRANQPVALLVLWEMEGKYRAGGQNIKTYPKILAQDIINTGIYSTDIRDLTPDRIKELALNREYWNQIISKI